jgi:hypothetical protein
VEDKMRRNRNRKGTVDKEKVVLTQYTSRKTYLTRQKCPFEQHTF